MQTDFRNPPNPEAYYATVWKVVRLVPPGRVASYGQVAAFIPCPAETPPTEYESYRARWAGQAMARSPKDVPWQRIISAQGMIAQKQAQLQAQQRLLLEAEGIVFDKKGRVDMGLFGWAGPDEEWLKANRLAVPPGIPRQGSLW